MHNLTKIFFLFSTLGLVASGCMLGPQPEPPDVNQTDSGYFDPDETENNDDADTRDGIDNPCGADTNLGYCGESDAGIGVDADDCDDECCDSDDAGRSGPEVPPAQSPSIGWFDGGVAPNDVQTDGVGTFNGSGDPSTDEREKEGTEEDCDGENCEDEDDGDEEPSGAAIVM